MFNTDEIEQKEEMSFTAELESRLRELEFQSEASEDSFDEISDEEMFKVDIWEKVDEINSKKEQVIEKMTEMKYLKISEIKAEYLFELKGIDDIELVEKI